MPVIDTYIIFSQSFVTFGVSLLVLIKEPIFQDLTNYCCKQGCGSDWILSGFEKVFKPDPVPNFFQKQDPDPNYFQKQDPDPTKTPGFDRIRVRNTGCKGVGLPTSEPIWKNASIVVYDEFFQ